MGLLVPPRRFNPAVFEMMDRPESDAAVLRDDLKNLRTINKYFGGLRTIRKHVVPMFKKIGNDREIKILDLATGSGDHPRALVAVARNFGYRVKITAVDKNPVMLEVASELNKNVREIRVDFADLFSLPYHEKSFDVVLCSLVLHHFSRDNAVLLLSRIDALARVGWIVQDLNRSWLAAWTAWLYTHLTTRNPMTLYDSYVSVLRAFTPDELAGIARDAGLTNFRISKHPFFRLVIAGEKNPH